MMKDFDTLMTAPKIVVIATTGSHQADQFGVTTHGRITLSNKKPRIQDPGADVGDQEFATVVSLQFNGTPSVSGQNLESVHPACRVYVAYVPNQRQLTRPVWTTMNSLDDLAWLFRQLYSRSANMKVIGRDIVKRTGCDDDAAWQDLAYPGEQDEQAPDIDDLIEGRIGKVLPVTVTTPTITETSIATMKEVRPTPIVPAIAPAPRPALSRPQPAVGAATHPAASAAATPVRTGTPIQPHVPTPVAAREPAPVATSTPEAVVTHATGIAAAESVTIAQTPRSGIAGLADHLNTAGIPVKLVNLALDPAPVSVPVEEPVPYEDFDGDTVNENPLAHDGADGQSMAEHIKDMVRTAVLAGAGSLHNLLRSWGLSFPEDTLFEFDHGTIPAIPAEALVDETVLLNWLRTELSKFEPLDHADEIRRRAAFTVDLGDGRTLSISFKSVNDQIVLHELVDADEGEVYFSYTNYLNGTFAQAGVEAISNLLESAGWTV